MGQWTVAWGRARDSSPSRRPRDQGHRKPLPPRQRRGISVQQAFRRPCWGAAKLDGRQPGASLTLCPRLPSRAPPGGRLEQAPRFVATLGRMTHEILICSLGGLKPAFCKLRTHRKTSNLQAAAGRRFHFGPDFLGGLLATSSPCLRAQTWATIAFCFVKSCADSLGGAHMAQFPMGAYSIHRKKHDVCATQREN